MRSVAICLLSLCCMHSAYATGEAERYVFAWPFVDAAELEPRGGTTRGPVVDLRAEPTRAWASLQEEGLSEQERDRRAILALAGDHRTSFDFLEVVVFHPPYEPAQPYRSWATERIYVLEDRPDFVSLQHVLVMFHLTADGERQGPFVQKHWRQDWQYEPALVLEYTGDRVWRERAVAPEERAGRWAQSVFHVDDSPRYGSVGKWRHSASASFWTDGGTWRPLPQREHTVRDDYDVLVGTNRLTVQPTGWVHEQDNLKTVLGDAGILAAPSYRAREIGVNRYERIEAFDFSAADDYWQATSTFWAEVRTTWEQRLGEQPLRVQETCAGIPSFMRLFTFAGALAGGREPNAGEIRSFVHAEIDCIVDPAGTTAAAAAQRRQLP
jgi:hypothetical protein